MAESKTHSNFGYQSVSATPEQENSQDEASRPKIELGDHPQLAKKRGWLATAAWQIFALLWLAPVIALMYLNFTEYIIGASAWCPAGECWLNAFNPVTAIPAEKARKFDRESHNLLGGLQFVAKALEIWFGIIAAAVMYLYTMKIAGNREGLPIGYMTRPMEFADPITLLDGLLWKTGPSPFGMKSAAEKRVGRRVWTLIIMSIFLCILINLMGPATAVLVIPALQWLEMPKVGPSMFQHMNSAQPPQINADSWFWKSLRYPTQDPRYCTASDIVAQNYSCTLTPYGDEMDSWFSTYQSSQGLTGFATHQELIFSANLTSDASTDNSFALAVAQNKSQQYRNVVWWAPLRQMISNLAVDYEIVRALSFGFPTENITQGFKATDGQPTPIDTYVQYNKSLALSLIRNGPILGTAPVMWADNNAPMWTVDVAADKQIRCYPWYDLQWSPLSWQTASGNYTKCIQTGSGWNSNNKRARFYTEQLYNSDTKRVDPGVDITVFSSHRAAFFENGTLPSWLPAACLTEGPILNRTSCPWDRMFTTDPSSEIFNRTQNVNTVEFYMANTTGATTKFVVDYVAFVDFTYYYIDANPVTNPGKIVQTGDLPSSGTVSIPVDPAWYLAAWSTAEDATLLNNRTSTLLLTSLMQWKLANPLWNWSPSTYSADYLTVVPIFQTLSLIDYTTTATTATKSSDPNHPILQRWANMYTWAYGLTSRTAHLGIAVAIAGCLVVAWHFVLGFTDRRRYRSPTQLLVAALEHTPKGEFAGKGHDELAMARVRFHVRDNDMQVGKFSFYEPDEGPAQELVTKVQRRRGREGSGVFSLERS